MSSQIDVIIVYNYHMDCRVNSSINIPWISARVWLLVLSGTPFYWYELTLIPAWKSNYIH